MHLYTIATSLWPFAVITMRIVGWSHGDSGMLADSLDLDLLDYNYSTLDPCVPLSWSLQPVYIYVSECVYVRVCQSVWEYVWNIQTSSFKICLQSSLLQRRNLWCCHQSYGNGRHVCTLELASPTFIHRACAEGLGVAGSLIGRLPIRPPVN